MRVYIALVVCMATMVAAAAPIHYVTPTYDDSTPAANAAMPVDCSPTGCGNAPSAPMTTNVVIDEDPANHAPAWNDPNQHKPRVMKSLDSNVPASNVPASNVPAWVKVPFCQRPGNAQKKRCVFGKPKKESRKRVKESKKTKKAAKKADKVAKDIAKLKQDVKAVQAAPGAPGNTQKILADRAKVQEDKAKVAAAKAQLQSKSKQGPKTQAVLAKLNKESAQLKKIDSQLKGALNGKKPAAKPAANKPAANKPAANKPAAKKAKSPAAEELTKEAVRIAKMVRAVEDQLLKEAKLVDQKQAGVTKKLLVSQTLIRDATAALGKFFKKITALLKAKKITRKEAADERKAAGLIKTQLLRSVSAALIVKNDNKKMKAKVGKFF